MPVEVKMELLGKTRELRSKCEVYAESGVVISWRTSLKTL